MSDPLCFVIGPIGDRLAAVGSPDRQIYEDAIEVWEKVVLPACEAAGLKPRRADQISRTGEIVDQVCRQLQAAGLVIADLTGANPNVMYELGLRHTVNRPTIQIGERSRLSFDVSAIRTIQFTRSESGFIDARKQLLEAIKTGLSEGGDPVTATRVWNDLPSVPDHAAATEERCDEEEVGFLGKLAASEDGMEKMASILESMTTVLGDIGTLVGSAVNEAEHSDARGGGARGRLSIMERLAARLDDQGAMLDAQSREFEDCVNRVAPGVDYLLAQLESNPALREQASAFIAGISELAEITESTERSIPVLQEEMRTSGEMSRSMRRANKRLVAAFGRVQKAYKRFAEWRNRSQIADEGGQRLPTRGVVTRDLDFVLGLGLGVGSPAPVCSRPANTRLQRTQSARHTVRRTARASLSRQALRRLD